MNYFFCRDMCEICIEINRKIDTTKQIPSIKEICDLHDSENPIYTDIHNLYHFYYNILYIINTLYNKNACDENVSICFTTEIPLEKIIFINNHLYLKGNKFIIIKSQKEFIYYILIFNPEFNVYFNDKLETFTEVKYTNNIIQVNIYINKYNKNLLVKGDNTRLLSKINNAIKVANKLKCSSCINIEKIDESTKIESTSKYKASDLAIFNFNDKDYDTNILRTTISINDKNSYSKFHFIDEDNIIVYSDYINKFLYTCLSDDYVKPEYLFYFTDSYIAKHKLEHLIVKPAPVPIKIVSYRSKKNTAPPPAKKIKVAEITGDDEEEIDVVGDKDIVINTNDSGALDSGGASAAASGGASAAASGGASAAASGGASAAASDIPQPQTICIDDEVEIIDKKSQIIKTNVINNIYLLLSGSRYKFNKSLFNYLSNKLYKKLSLEKLISHYNKWIKMSSDLKSFWSSIDHNDRFIKPENIKDHKTNIAKICKLFPELNIIKDYFEKYFIDNIYHTYLHFIFFNKNKIDSNNIVVKETDINSLSEKELYIMYNLISNFYDDIPIVSIKVDKINKKWTALPERVKSIWLNIKNNIIDIPDKTKFNSEDVSYKLKEFYDKYIKLSDYLHKEVTLYDAYLFYEKVSKYETCKWFEVHPSAFDLFYLNYLKENLLTDNFKNQEIAKSIWCNVPSKNKSVWYRKCCFSKKT